MRFLGLGVVLWLELGLGLTHILAKHSAPAWRNPHRNHLQPIGLQIRSPCPQNRDTSYKTQEQVERSSSPFFLSKRFRRTHCKQIMLRVYCMQELRSVTVIEGVPTKFGSQQAVLPSATKTTLPLEIWKSMMMDWLVVSCPIPKTCQFHNHPKMVRLKIQIHRENP